MLPYSAEVLFAQFDTYNRTIWPAPAVAAAFALVLFYLWLRPFAAAARIGIGLLALGWLWTGLVYHLQYFATLNFAAPAYATVFAVEAGLLLWSGPLRNRVPAGFDGGAAAWSGLVLALAALLSLPAADAAAGVPGWGFRIAGIAPAPTALFTLGVLLMTPARTPWRLVVLPVLWLLGEGATAWILEIRRDLVLPALAVAVVVLVWRKNRQIASGER